MNVAYTQHLTPRERRMLKRLEARLTRNAKIRMAYRRHRRAGHGAEAALRLVGDRWPEISYVHLRRLIFGN